MFLGIFDCVVDLPTGADNDDTAVAGVLMHVSIGGAWRIFAGAIEMSPGAPGCDVLAIDAGMLGDPDRGTPDIGNPAYTTELDQGTYT